MKKIYWIRRIFLLSTIYIAGAASTGANPTWIKFLLAFSLFGFLLLSEEFEFDLRSRTSGR